jgi:hypothetical protein
MSDQNPAAPGPPDPADAAEAVSEAAAPVENAPQAAAEHVTETVEAPVAEAVTEVVEAPAAPVPATPPPAFDAGSVPPPPPPGYAAPAAATIPVFPNGKPMLDATGQPVSDKSRLAAALLCWFVGVFGVHRFYVGKVGTGVAMLVTCGGLGVWALIDLVVILLGSFRDQEGRALQNW